MIIVYLIHEIPIWVLFRKLLKYYFSSILFFSSIFSVFSYELLSKSIPRLDFELRNTMNNIVKFNNNPLKKKT